MLEPQLAPLIPAIGMSIFVKNLVQVMQGARVKPIAPVLVGGVELGAIGDQTIHLAWTQLLIIVVTVVLMLAFTWLITQTTFGRRQRSCEQDRTMTALLDEPSLGLAPLYIRKIVQIVRELDRDAGMTILRVEQNANHALRVAHRAYVLQHGEIVLAGSGAELLASPEVRAAYLEGGHA